LSGEEEWQGYLALLCDIRMEDLPARQVDGDGSLQQYDLQRKLGNVGERFEIKI
jgi:hypothetical protein